MRRSAPIVGLAAAAASLAFSPASSSGLATFANVTSPASPAVIPRLYKNCTNFKSEVPARCGEAACTRQDLGHAGEDVLAEHADLPQSDELQQRTRPR
jgi:hypothetical protein